MTDNDWQRKRKIVHLTGTKLTPEVVLARTLEKARAGEIESVLIGIEWKPTPAGECLYDLDWSNMSASSATFINKMIDNAVARMVEGHYPAFGSDEDTDDR